MFTNTRCFECLTLQHTGSKTWYGLFLQLSAGMKLQVSHLEAFHSLRSILVLDHHRVLQLAEDFRIKKGLPFGLSIPPLVENEGPLLDGSESMETRVIHTIKDGPGKIQETVSQLVDVPWQHPFVDWLVRDENAISLKILDFHFVGLVSTGVAVVDGTKPAQCRRSGRDLIITPPLCGGRLTKRDGLRDFMHVGGWDQHVQFAWPLQAAPPELLNSACENSLTVAKGAFGDESLCVTPGLAFS